MPDRRGPSIYTIPPHRAFSDALVAGILSLHGKDPMALARGTIILPNNRAKQAIADAFLRQSEGGLLLPRLVPIGDSDLDEQIGLALDPIEANPIAAAIDPLQRQLILARLIQQAKALDHDPVDCAQAMRMAADFGRTLDQLIVEEKNVADLTGLQVDQEVSEHWQKALDLFTRVFQSWPNELADLGRIDGADRKNRQLNGVARGWSATPPKGFIIAAGISTTAPAVANLLRAISRLENGRVVLAGLDLYMPDAEWDAIGGGEDEQAIESHPQYHLHLLLDRLGVSRLDVQTWRWGSDSDARANRSRAISNALAPAEFTRKWIGLGKTERDLFRVKAMETANPADEAQAIALSLRHAIEAEGYTAALVTPDRDLARRVSAHLRRWGINADDSAGQSLTTTPIGTLILSLVGAFSERLAPVALLALLKHPLVHGDQERLAWLDGARRLDRALRGPRPAENIAGVTAFLLAGDPRERKIRDAALTWWRAISPLLVPLEVRAARPFASIAEGIALIRDGVAALAGDDAWTGESGRAAADLLTNLEHFGQQGPLSVSLEHVPMLLRTLMDGIAIRPSYGGHARIAIWGLLEAKLQSAHFMVLGGLNEGIWPTLPSPDPWLAPRIRSALGLPGLERRIGLSAHDLAGALGAPDILLSRSMTDARSPTIASRFWLRLQAISGGMAPPEPRYDLIARALDQSVGPPNFAPRPAPCPPVDMRPRTISVTDVDGLQADPFAFYATKILGLRALDLVDADPGPSWRGTLVHAILKEWADVTDYAPDTLVGLVDAALDKRNVHPLIKILWQPRLAKAAEWVSQTVAEGRLSGREPLAAELSGAIKIFGVTLKGQVDRIDTLDDGSLAIIDYKTGEPPSNKMVATGFALQLGLLGLIADKGGFNGIGGRSKVFEYWSLSKQKKGKDFGWFRSPTKAGSKSQNITDPNEFVAIVARQLEEAAGIWLTGNAPFTAKLHPEFSWSEHDHLMRLEEWEGRGG